MNLPARLLLGALFIAAVAPTAARGQDGGTDPGPGRKEGGAPFLFRFAVWESEISEGELQVFLVEGVTMVRGEFSLEARNVVLWADPVAARNEGGLLTTFADRAAGREAREGGAKVPPPPAPVGLEKHVPADLRAFLGPVLHSIYAEGGVVFRLGNRTIRTERLYVDFRRKILATGKVDLTLGIGIESRGHVLPLVVRAGRMRQVTMDTTLLEDAVYTTCDFEEPHFAFHATSFEITDEEEYKTFTAWNNVLRVEGVPIFWLPALSGSSNLSARPLRNATLRRSSRFGTEGLLLWGDDIPVNGARWGEWRLHTDWRSARGFGVGPEVQYDHGNLYEGELIGYYQRDRARTDRFDDSPVPRENRGRVRWEHRQNLSRDLRLDLSLFDFSDRNFQREYLKKEALNDRDPETYAYLLWRRGTDEASLSATLRTDRFRTETTELPDGTFRRIGSTVSPSLVPAWLLDSLTWSLDARAGAYEREFDEALGVRGDRVTRQDAVARIEGTRWVGPVSLSPFASAGGTTWQGIEESGGGGGDMTRGDLAAGLRAGIEARRDFGEVASGPLDLRGLRHVVALEALFYDRATVTRDPAGARAVDRIDTLDEARVGVVRLRNRLQTERGGRRVDWIDFEVRGNWYPDGLSRQAPPIGFKEEGLEEARYSDFAGEEKYRAGAPSGEAGPVEADLRVRLRENLYLFAEGEYSLDEDRMITSAQGIRWFVAPRFSVYLGRRVITRDSDIYTASADLFLSERWALRVVQQTDFRGEGGLKSVVELRRVWHDFVLEIAVENDRLNHDNSFSFSILPTALWEPPTSAEKIGRLDFEAQRWYR